MRDKAALVIPEADWTTMRFGNDALNSDSFILEQSQKLFLPGRFGKISKDIFNANSHLKWNKSGSLVLWRYLSSKSSPSPFFPADSKLLPRLARKVE